ncbi:ATP-binding cassette domain-containing protein [Marinilactibacillus sp. XAAS-LB27]|uniref:ATP-binding cassette domain-containing protein n=1 Tax=Marinilactibacillus sp. XAAS-LB27 TaxID=3114538 RepID=UPI002E19F552|nr:ATP-binding cassette domain-containing protein [Marinilactibacillus sp. XAAS-LB27]
MTLTVKNLTIAYGKRTVLENISFTIDKGTIIGLVAPNGTGKTTLFNAVMRFIPVKEGEVYLNEKQYTEKEADVLALHKQITFFPNQDDLYENFTGTEHIQMYAKVWSGKELAVEDIIDQLQMRDYVGRPVRTYSLGMRQRLCFAMMVAANTPVMFMDEVMNGLDPENVSLVSDILIELRKSGKIIIVASHLLDNLDEYADKVFFLKDKKLFRINDHHERKPDFYKVVCSKEQVRMLEQTMLLPEETIHLGNSVLCIPVDALTEEEQIVLFRQIRSLKNTELKVGPLGTSEYYSHIYGLEIHSFDRGNQADVETTE